MDEYEEEIKVIFPHASGAGATSIIEVLIGLPFKEGRSMTTSSESFVNYFVEINNKKYCLNLWEIISQKACRPLTKIFLKNSKIVIFVYDITSRSSFEDLNNWIKDVKEILGNNYICGLIGTKSDLFLKKEVREEEAESFAKSQGMKLRFVSAKNPIPIRKFIDELCYDYLCKFVDDKLIMKKYNKKDKKEKKKKEIKEIKAKKENINIDERKILQLHKLNINYIKTISKYNNY